MRLVNTTEFDARRILGAALLDVPRLLGQLAKESGWVRASNRIEKLTPDPDGPGYRCDFQWGSSLHACRVFPWLGTLMLRRAFGQWPVHFADDEVAVSPEPALTFIIPFRGTERLPQLRAVVRSILAQEGVQLECIVIEQSNQSQAREHLPAAVRYIHLPHPDGDPGWRKSWAFNVAAGQARAPVLVCHDGDILVPTGYGQALIETLAHGFDSVHIQRFLFYLNAGDTERVLGGGRLDACCPDEVRHNWVGGTLAIRRDAYFGIGGFDERFVDWGGEDNEFFDRCLTLRHCRYGYVPFVHLWHRPQENRLGSGRERALDLMRQRLAVPTKDRIVELRGQNGFQTSRHVRVGSLESEQVA
ncbi:hypothetical protein CKO25_10530 [Thiocapsa imhoffii]|uniref:Glycosyltransferase n=1 Tax=Thiocapsa imhoffii TaxID=382777 RepID=A0A9X1B9H5_9GAMM|nr:galactosyltransferase-related protein [Thiocapsa imhoffii]MBK1645080.1 hypothetical protein [Thiocapsa imhoffii]